MADRSTETPKRRRRFAISLRLMIVVLVVGLVLGWREPRQAAQAILACGGLVKYNRELVNGSPTKQ